MADSKDFTIVPRRSSAVEKAEPGAKRILTVMISDALTIARSSKLDAEAIYQRGLRQKDDSLAAALFKEAAMLGHPVAQYRYGYMLWKGIVMAADGTEWLKWLRSSAEQGYVRAQFRLGKIYYQHPDALRWPQHQPEVNAASKDPSWQELFAKPKMKELLQQVQSLGLDQQKREPAEHHVRAYVESAKWYRMAAEQGHSISQNHLAQLYQSGKGVPLDNLEALKWHRKAAEQGSLLSQLELSVVYQHGIGVPKDDLESEKWYLLACKTSPKNVEGYKKCGWSQEYGWSKVKLKPVGIL